MCDCIKNIERDVLLKHNAARASFEHLGSRWSEVSYYLFRKDGQVYQRARYDLADWKFCPFCGCKIEGA